ncbi:glycogen debranching protein GlgX [Pontivivens insulae]|uniref:Glycogen operon protein GlgX n=1 Tax=Pontivivens insulae TaxID=1639689 RepID=A0A2R8ADJ1_9RHOB|nr:glycogen debranching protein GlgX [Pontivivens insulae]RED14074.1 glycogen operon protein [Pontivivens insulae]SPF30148.1 Glycogen operon protein GlgX [Pontivivens insulae]
MQAPYPPGAHLTADGCRVTVYAPEAASVWVEGPRGTTPLEQADGWWTGLCDLAEGEGYHLRADGQYDPDAAQWFDPDKRLVDPYATEISAPYTYDPVLGAYGLDTRNAVPLAVVRAPLPDLTDAPVFTPGGLIYEVNVRGFTLKHPDVPEAQRGTVAALAHPAIIAHLKSLHVAAVELMPITATLDERHLPPLGLRNFWGYNPVTFMALDPRLCPGGMSELRDTVAALRDAGIGVLLDLVFNHTAESDSGGPTVSFRGLANRDYYRHTGQRLVNDTGCGNTVACDHPVMREMIRDTLCHFRLQAGVDGFRFDLGPVLGRTADGFSAEAETLAMLRDDPVIGAGHLIMEPWDIGPGGYQLGQFGAPFLEWNDRYRDDIRRIWRGDAHRIGDLATRLAGSFDTFAVQTRSVNFIAAHDGFTLADMVAHAEKHNQANGEGNRDGHNENLSWNNGVEGPTDDPAIRHARRADVAGLLGTLFASRGTIMLTAGDEFGRSQQGNNNAYCQDSEIGWIDWEGRDRVLEGIAQLYATARAAVPALAGLHEWSGQDVEWLTLEGAPMEHWWDADALMMRIDGAVIAINPTHHARQVQLPEGEWIAVRDFGVALPARSVEFWLERVA